MLAHRRDSVSVCRTDGWMNRWMGYKNRLGQSTELKEVSCLVNMATSSHKSIAYDLDSSFTLGLLRELCRNLRKSRKEMKHFPKLCQFSKSPSLEIFILCLHSTDQHLWSFPLNCWVNCPFPAIPSLHFPHPDPHPLLPKLH